MLKTKADTRMAAFQAALAATLAGDADLNSPALLATVKAAVNEVEGALARVCSPSKGTPLQFRANWRTLRHGTNPVLIKTGGHNPKTFTHAHAGTLPAYVVDVAVSDPAPRHLDVEGPLRFHGRNGVDVTRGNNIKDRVIGIDGWRRATVYVSIKGKGHAREWVMVNLTLV